MRITWKDVGPFIKGMAAGYMIALSVFFYQIHHEKHEPKDTSHVEVQQQKDYGVTWEGEAITIDAPAVCGDDPKHIYAYDRTCPSKL